MFKDAVCLKVNKPQKKNCNLLSAARKQDNETQVHTNPELHFSRTTEICYGDCQYLWVLGTFNFAVLVCIILRWLREFLNIPPWKLAHMFSICSLFNNAVNNLRYVASDDRVSI